MAVGALSGWLVGFFPVFSVHLSIMICRNTLSPELGFTVGSNAMGSSVLVSLSMYQICLPADSPVRSSSLGSCPLFFCSFVACAMETVWDSESQANFQVPPTEEVMEWFLLFHSPTRSSGFAIGSPGYDTWL